MTPRRRSVGRAALLVLAASAFAATSPPPAGAREMPLEAVVSTPAAEAEVTLDEARGAITANVTVPALEASGPTPVGPVAVTLPEAHVDMAVDGGDTAPAAGTPPRTTRTEAKRRKAERTSRPAAGGGPRPSSVPPQLREAAAAQALALSHPAAASAGDGALGPGPRSPAPGSSSPLSSSAGGPHAPFILGVAALVALALAAALLGGRQPWLLPLPRPSPHDLFLKHPD